MYDDDLCSNKSFPICDDGNIAQSISNAIRSELASLAENNPDLQFLIYDFIGNHFHWAQFSQSAEISKSRLGSKAVNDFQSILKSDFNRLNDFEAQNTILLDIDVPYNEMIIVGTIPLWIISSGFIRNVLTNYSTVRTVDPILKN